MLRVHPGGWKELERGTKDISENGTNPRSWLSDTQRKPTRSQKSDPHRKMAVNTEHTK